MRLYETVFVLDPSLDEHTVEKERAKVEELITSRKGTVKRIDRWGMRKSHQQETTGLLHPDLLRGRWKPP